MIGTVLFSMFAVAVGTVFILFGCTYEGRDR